MASSKRCRCDPSLYTRPNSPTDVPLQPHAWQPFGNGMRACIGRPFSWQEAQLALISILQRFDLVMRDPTYELQLKQSITIKPHNFFIHAIPRADRPRLLAIPSAPAPQLSVAAPGAEKAQPIATEGMKPLYVLYGSNTGTSESFAQRIVSAAPAHGTPSRATSLRNEMLTIYVTARSQASARRSRRSTWRRSTFRPTAPC